MIVPWIKYSVAVAVIVALSISHIYVYRVGANNERAASLERSIDVLRSRANTNEQIRNMGDADLCVALGGRMQDESCI